MVNKKKNYGWNTLWGKESRRRKRKDHYWVVERKRTNLSRVFSYKIYILTTLLQLSNESEKYQSKLSFISYGISVHQKVAKNSPNALTKNLNAWVNSLIKGKKKVLHCPLQKGNFQILPENKEMEIKGKIGTPSNGISIDLNKKKFFIAILNPSFLWCFLINKIKFGEIDKGWRLYKYHYYKIITIFLKRYN